MHFRLIRSIIDVVEQTQLKLCTCVYVSTSTKPANARAIQWNNFKDTLDFIISHYALCSVAYAVELFTYQTNPNNSRLN